MKGNDIHNSAVIGMKTDIDDGVKIGAYSIIGSGVKIGKGCVLKDHVVIGDNVFIGNNNTFYPFCSIGQQSQDLKYSGEPTYLKIGNDNTFREFVTVNRATDVGNSTIIGNKGNFLAYSHIAHDCKVGDNVIFSNAGTLAGHVEVGDYAVLGGLSAVHQFCKIGKHSLIGGCAKIVQDLPPFFIADGNPGELRGLNLVGLKRRGFSDDVIYYLKKFYKMIFLKKTMRANLSLKIDDFLNEVKNENDSNNDRKLPNEILEIIEFIKSSDRGIIR